MTNRNSNYSLFAQHRLCTAVDSNAICHKVAELALCDMVTWNQCWQIRLGYDCV